MVPLLAPPVSSSNVCLEIEDNTTARFPAVDFFGIRGLRDPAPTAARFAEQFIHQNDSLAAQLGVAMEAAYDGRDVMLQVTSGNSVGAIPLASPTSARPDFGLVVQPRFPWAGIGPMLAAMGWRVSPTPLKLPLLRRSERRVPRWVLSSMILVRLKALLDALDRRFETVEEELRSPRGSVRWSRYATVSLPRARFLAVPCAYPDLRDDRLLKGAIRHALEQQICSLETQREYGAFVHQLIEFAAQLHHRVRSIPICIPAGATLISWQQRPLRSEAVVEGLRAIEWTLDERGLAGVSDLEGIPWTMPMEEFFEAWVETILVEVARKTGARLRVARTKETTRPIEWDPPYSGSQRSLVPDVWLEWNDLTVIVEAKYKRHFEEIGRHSWSKAEEVTREEHRRDVLQALAYANLARTQKVVSCLAYPCSTTTFRSLQERRRLIHRAQLTVESRTIGLWLTAVPMNGIVEDAAAPLLDEIRRTLN
jgi:hypothetical protein